jgi:ABC-type uncharacterized transport system substrate-binding protein
MNQPAKGFLKQSKLAYSLLQLLLLMLLLQQKAFADTTLNNLILKNADGLHQFHIAVMYSPDSTIQSTIAEQLSRTLAHIQTNARVSTITTSSNSLAEDNTPDLLIAIGSDNIQIANEHFSRTSKLLIASDPGSFSEKVSTDTQEAVLYMTQPYCRQIQLIKQINDQWRTISYFSSRKKPVDDSRLKQCAIKYDIQTYKVDITDTDHLTKDIKDALNHSDLILALPDKDIFNHHTVKNILLTSYRYRKPVIAFSKNFVTAGGLASIHSDTDQIARSASELIEQYIANDYKFMNTVNYPHFFHIDINTQVFNALDISKPDIDKIKRIIENSDSDNTR